MHIEQSEALLETLKATKDTLIKDISAWIDERPFELYIKTHLPIGLYQTIYEGKPQRYLEGIKIVGVARSAALLLLSSLAPTSQLRQLVSHWLAQYDPTELQLAADATLLVTKEGLVFSDSSLEYPDMQLVELVQLLRFLNTVSNDLAATLTVKNQPEIKRISTNRKPHLSITGQLRAGLIRRLASGARLVMKPHHE